jgi:DNA polymerase (family 10)
VTLKALPNIFEEIAGLLEIKGENPFKVRAYERAARVLMELDDLEKIIKEKRLKEIEGIGEAISKKIEEYYETGKISYHEELKKEIPLSLLELMKIPALGAKKIRTLHQKLGITDIGELEYACRENHLLALPGFGKKTQDRILSGIEFLKRHKDEFLLGEIEGIAEQIKESLSSNFKEAKVEICGSVRRKREVVKDIDLLITSPEEEKIREYLKSLPAIKAVILEDGHLTVLKLVTGINLELRTVREEEYPLALLYLTGNKDHIEGLRTLCEKMGLHLQPYRLSKGKETIKLKSEDEFYDLLGLQFVPPELREGSGEIDAALGKKIPELVKEEDLKGIFHIHTDFSDGLDSIETLVGFAKKMGFQYIGISDHSGSAYYARGLKIEDLKRQWHLIDEINRREANFYVFKGIESDILPDGSLDYPPEILRRFDFVIASIHSHFKLDEKEQRERIITALKNPYVTIFGHPTGRLLLSREGYRIDLEEIIEISEKYGVVLELNSSPYRLDLDWRYLRRAKERNVIIAINPDAHSKAGLFDTKFGIAMARKGWLERKNILNTKNVDEIRNFFSERKRGAT